MVERISGSPRQEVPRRVFLGSALAAMAPAVAPLVSADTVGSPVVPVALPSLPDRIAGMTLVELRNDYRDRLFRQYLPFWERGGLDSRTGAVVCELNDDGSLATDEVFIWYQGRGLWVYSFLYNELGKDPRWLEIARRTAGFLVRHMYAQDGKWCEKVRSDGPRLAGIGETVYGWLFAAGGLAEYFLATGDQPSLDIAKRSVLAAVAAYDDPKYTDTHTALYTAVELPAHGLRSQGHSMVLVNILSRLLAKHDDPQLLRVLDDHLDALRHKFWNPEYGIVNEYLAHDYSRIAGADDHMLAGHALEGLWMIMHEAVRRKDRAMFDESKARIRRLLEMCWDYVFEGWGDGNYFVFDSPKHRRGPEFEIKTMWAHCEALVAAMSVLEYTAEAWAKEWYERTRAFALRTMPVAGHGVWRQAVDRFGKDIQRAGVSTKRKDNFHQVRYLMLNLLSLERMIAQAGRPTPFPG